jgi:hypothetical protein
VDNLRLQILEGNYWEHHKVAKDLALILPIDHPKRLKIEKELNDIASQIRKIKNNE